MAHSSQLGLVAIFLTAAFIIHSSLAMMASGSTLRTSDFLSPAFVLGPGSVVNEYYHDIDFPRGHIALKSFNAEVVDEAGNPIPLYETYLHHWLVVRYYGLKDGNPPVKTIGWDHRLPKTIPAGNSGICRGTLTQYFGLGSETRKTSTWVPDPYAIEAGNPETAPFGYEERWMLNVHAIDTRGVVDRLGCTECKCDLYNVTEDEFGRPIKKDYTGGLFCCYDKTQCRVKEGFTDVRRKLYLRYTVEWLDWNDGTIPVKIYILDVTDSGMRSNTSIERFPYSSCKVEYEVESCVLKGTANYNNCVDSKRAELVMPRGGSIIYGVAHQHTGGVGAALYGQDGRTLCASLPVYGEGVEAGNEAGYVVGMTTCYPTPGSVKIAKGEIVSLESNYSATEMHTGVMGLFYILVADEEPVNFRSVISMFQRELMQSGYSWILLGVGMMAFFAILGFRRRSGQEEGYQSLAA